MNTETTQIGIPYRPEIDGLRAIAVLSVVLNHAGFWPPSGFVGVDIFFVISGYLITSLIYKEWKRTNNVVLFDFYARRVRRLFAALVVVICATVVASVYALSPYGEIKHATYSAAAAFLLSSNIFFNITTGGYFDSNSATYPLLHLWSLSVEEQFYLIWPIIVIFILRISPNRIITILILATACSLVGAEVLIASYPQAAFYQMPARFWELASGGVIAMLPPDRPRYSRHLALTGLVFIVVAISKPTIHFPGLGAAPAVLGALMILYEIHAKSRLGLAGSILRSRPSVFIGLISYSLYLWHWPLLSLYRATHAGESPFEVRVLLCLIAVGLAWITYEFVEKPLRRPDPRTNNKSVVIVGFAASITLAVTVLTIGSSLDQPLPPNDLASVTERDWPSNRHDCHYRGDEALTVFPKTSCNAAHDKSINVVIWGDSMAFAWQPFAWFIGQLSAESVISYTRDSCPPIIDYNNGKSKREESLCRDFNSLVISKINSVDTLIIGARWPLAIETNGEFKEKFASTMNRISSGARRIVVLGPTPTLKDAVPQCIRTNNLDACSVERAKFESASSEIKAFLLSLTKKFDNIQFVDPTNFFCAGSTCPAIKDGYGLYWDSFHVSSTAAREFAKSFIGSGSSGK